MCPKKLSEMKTPNRTMNKVGGKKIEFSTIIQTINQGDLYYSCSEVHKDLVKGKIGRFRTLKLLNLSYQQRKIDRVYDEGKFQYGPASNLPALPTKTK